LEHGLRAAGYIDDYLNGRGEIPVAAMQPYYPNYRFKKLLRMLAAKFSTKQCSAQVPRYEY
jgi:hypothetical protein